MIDSLETCNNEYGVEDRYLLDTITMEDLYEKQYVENNSIIENFLNTGTYIFAGSPKVGKSFMVTQIAYCVSKGLDLWGLKTRQHDVLYLALEDTYKRLQSRLYKMFGDEPSEHLHLAVNAGNFSDGNLIIQLRNFLTLHRDTKLIIIDTLQKIREASNEYSYSKDYDVISELKNIADEKHLCLLIVHHTRKMEDTDKLNTISGTNGLFGASDGAYVMYKHKRIGNEAFIDISTRDSSDNRIKIVRDDKTLCWEAVEESNPPKADTDNIVDIIGGFININNQKWEGTATELIEDLNMKDLMSPRAISYKININTNAIYDKYKVCTLTRKSNGKHLIRFVYDSRNPEDETESQN